LERLLAALSDVGDDTAMQQTLYAAVTSGRNTSALPYTHIVLQY
jgi:hypothetical protein